MLSRNVYLGQEGLEEVNQFIELQLNNGSTVDAIVNAMKRDAKGALIITKEYGESIEYLQPADITEMLKEYVEENFSDHIVTSGITDEMQRVLEENFNGMDLDEYADTLTSTLSEGCYQKIHKPITEIMISFEPYMREKIGEKYDELSELEKEVALMETIKDHLITRKRFKKL